MDRAASRQAGDRAGGQIHRSFAIDIRERNIAYDSAARIYVDDYLRQAVFEYEIDDVPRIDRDGSGTEVGRSVTGI